MSLLPILLTLTSLFPAQAPAASPAGAQALKERPVLALDLEESRARSLNMWFDQSKHWALSGIVLCSYGPRWHPAGSESLVAALKNKQPELRAFALETLLATDPAHLPVVLTPALIDTLVVKGLAFKHELLKSATLKVLSTGLPTVNATSTLEWKNWWKVSKADYAPLPWDLPKTLAVAPEDEVSSAGFIARAFDLNTAGMEMAIVIDTTGSMQRTIDASALALSDITLIMEGVAPKLRVGLVEYKDLQDMSGGAKQLEKLTPKVRTRLGKLSASGGGDVPESILGGLHIALADKMGWKRAANKLVVVIGDAPQRKKTRQELFDLAKGAHESPFGADASDIIEVSGSDKSNAKRGVRPFVISAIGVGDKAVAPQTRITMTELAKIGGGAYAEVLVGTDDGGQSASASIVKHILTLAFGSRWEAEMGRFLSIYLRYRDAGCFK